jgi:uncharacterized protein (TIGR02145 family)
MKTVIIFLLLSLNFSLLFAQENNAPEVTNVTFSQRTDGSFMVDVYYDVNDADGDTMSVTMQVSDDAGTTWNFSCENITGDVGTDITRGSGKHIAWDFGAEHPKTFGEQLQIKIIADDKFLETGTVTDIDGNVYQTVKIGEQWWMAENLKVTHYRNGDAIPNVTDNTEWPNLSTGAWCSYNNDAGNVSTYGLLYNWYTVADSRNIAPAGWHVPSDAEWQVLVDYLGGASVAGGKMKETGTTHWYSPNTGATNENGFSALPGGCRNYVGEFNTIGGLAYFWSFTESSSASACSRYLNANNSDIVRSINTKQYGCSVRLVRD